MIIERITAIRAIQPKVIVTQVPIGRDFHQVEAVRTIGSGERQIPEGATGTILDVSYDEVEVDFYSPKDLIVFAQQTQVRSR